MYSTTLQNLTIHYDRLGCGEPLVLIHGFGERKNGWFCQHPLADQFDLIIPNLRGHGDSTHTDDISMENFARDILSLLDHLNLESAHICGISMGGVVAQEIYRLAPERCRSLILVSSFFYVPRMIRIPLYFSWMWPATVLPPTYRMSLAASTCLHQRNVETLQRLSEAMQPKHEVYQQTLEACINVDNVQLLSQINVPTLIIGSDFDVLTPSFIQVMMHRLIKNSKLVILRHAGHMAKLEQPEEFNRTIREFLEQQTKKPRSQCS